MNKPEQPYTMGIWKVKPGNEEAFASAWKTFADWSFKNQEGAGHGYLLEDPENPQSFVSFGWWESVDAIRKWRARPEFNEFVGKAKALCDDFQPKSLRLKTTTEW